MKILYGFLTIGPYGKCEPSFDLNLKISLIYARWVYKGGVGSDPRIRIIWRSNIIRNFAKIFHAKSPGARGQRAVYQKNIRAYIREQKNPAWSYCIRVSFTYLCTCGPMAIHTPVINPIAKKIARNLFFAEYFHTHTKLVDPCSQCSWVSSLLAYV